MRSKYLLPLLFTFLLQGCASINSGSNKSEIFGKVNIIDESGYDITSFCSNHLKIDGIFIQDATVGANKLRPIVCTTWHYLYRINLDDLSVDVPEENLAVYFGDIEITLNKGNHNYVIRTIGENSSSLYKGKFSIKNGNLKIGSKRKYWTKNFLDGQFHFMFPGWERY